MVYDEEEYELTEEEKEAISNELEDLLNNYNDSNMTDTIKNCFVKYKYMYMYYGKMELQWYKLAEHFISVLRTKIERSKKSKK